MLQSLFYLISISIICHTDATFLGIVRSTVLGGTSAFFNITSTGYLLVQLTSETGDCDLYASTTNIRPDFDDYSIQSTTCGADSIVILKKTPRPVYLAMYGHPAHDLSTCTMTFCEVDVKTFADGYSDEMTELSIIDDSLLPSCKVSEAKSFNPPRVLNFIAEIALEVMLEIMGAY